MLQQKTRATLEMLVPLLRLLVASRIALIAALNCTRTPFLLVVVLSILRQPRILATLQTLPLCARYTIVCLGLLTAQRFLMSRASVSSFKRGFLYSTTQYLIFVQIVRQQISVTEKGLIHIFLNSAASSLGRSVAVISVVRILNKLIQPMRQKTGQKQLLVTSR